MNSTKRLIGVYGHYHNNTVASILSNYGFMRHNFWDLWHNERYFFEKRNFRLNYDIIIPNCRTQEELEFIKYNNGKIIYITKYRDNNWKDYGFDYHISNFKSKQELEKKLRYSVLSDLY